MKRRDFVSLFAGAAAAPLLWPLAARAQRTDRIMRRLGVLMAIAANDPEARRRVAAFEHGLRERGWIDGRNISIDYRWASDDPELMRREAAALVAAAPDLIFANSTPLLTALRKESTTLPMVFVQVTDPVGQGLVANLARPGGNVTGFTNFEFAIGGKWLQTLKEIAPAVTRVAVVFNPQTAPYAGALLRPIEAAAAKRSNEPRLLTNLGNAMLAKGDVQGAAESYTTATSVDASLVAPFYNLAVLYSRRAASEPPEAAVKDVQRAQNVSDVVSRLQPALIVPKDTSQPMLLNRSLLSPGLSSGEILTLVDAGDRDSKIESQLSLQLLGNVDAVLGWLYPVAIAIAFGGLSALLRRGKISKGCMRCGRQVCRRCDPQLSVGSALCQQCVNVFVRKNVVEPAVKIRKQIEIAQFRSEKEKLTYAFGLLCSGAGHVFSGLPIRGAIYVFLFLFALANILFRHGVLRYPYGAEPLFTRLAPLAAALIAVYLLSLRGLYKQQS